MFDLKVKYPEFYRFYGRRIAKKLSHQSKRHIETYFDNHSFDEEIVNCFNKKKFINTDQVYKKTILEIGFGNGEFLVNNSERNKDILYIGCEVYLNGFSNVLNYIYKNNVKNIRICSVNFIFLISVLRDLSLEKVYFINPDPWPKARHHKRRIVNVENLNLLTSKIKKNCSIIITTDSKEYYEYIISIINDPNLSIKKMKYTELNNSDSLYGISAYQRKAINRNDKIYKIELFNQ